MNSETTHSHCYRSRVWQRICMLGMLWVCSQGVLLAQEKPSLNMLTPEEYPEMEYRGQVKHAVEWQDAAGRHWLITTETGDEPNGEPGHSDAFVFAYQFLGEAGGQQRVDTFMDFVADCPVDLTAEFLGSMPTVTDLDSDGYTEIWLVYQLACRGDVSPAGMHVVLYLGGQRYTMQGTRKIIYPDEEQEGGNFQFDEAFLALPAPFRAFAQELWVRFELEQDYREVQSP